MPGESDKFLTVEDAAKELKVDTQTIRKWIRDGELPAISVGRQYRIKREDFDAFIEKRRTKPSKD